MKGKNMRTPCISEIYNQRLTYEFHIKRLERIREERKTQLTFDQNRLSQLQNMKESKNRSFASRFNEQNNKITKSNIRLLDKLEKVKPFARYTSFSHHDEKDKDAFLRPFEKKRVIETEKENSRIFHKMRSVSSSLNKDKLLRDYAKSQQIKSRITRYANQNNKIELKSQKFLNLSQSRLSSRNSERQTSHSKGQNLVSHYKKEQILKNRVAEDVNKKKQLANEEEGAGENKQFFATQPQKGKPKLQKRKVRF